MHGASPRELGRVNLAQIDRCEGCSLIVGAPYDLLLRSLLYHHSAISSKNSHPNTPQIAKTKSHLFIWHLGGI